MTLKELLEFNPKTKKNLIKHLKANKIKYKKDSVYITLLDSIIEDYSVIDLQYYVVNRTIHGIDITIDASNISFSELKERICSLLGKPIGDNTNHETNSPFTRWKYGILTLHHTKNKYLFVFFFDHTETPSKTKDSIFDFSYFLPSLVGGLVSGLLFFVLFGIGAGHSPLLFKLSMISGIIWGLSMYLGMCFFLLYPFQAKKRKAKFKKKQVKLLNEHGQLHYPKSTNNLAIYYEKIRNRFVQRNAKIFVNKNEINVAFYKNRKIKTISIQISDIERIYYIPYFTFISIVDKNGKDIRLCELQGNVQLLVDTIEDFLGYNSERFNNIYNIIYNCLIEYDPNSIIALGQDISILSDYARSLTKLIYGKKEITLEDIYYDIFDCEDSFNFPEDSAYEELAQIIRQKLIEENII